MRWFHSEPTIAEMLSDPIVRALMAADRVAPEELQANLTKLAGTLELRHPIVSQRDYSCGSSLG